MEPEDSLIWMHNKILKVVEDCVPLKSTVRPKQRIPPERRKLWSRHLKVTKRLLIEKSAVKMAKLITEKNEMEKELINDSKMRDEKEEKKACENISQNPKYFYTFAKRRQESKGSVGPFVDQQTGAINPDPLHTAEIMRNQYESVFSVPKTQSIVSDPGSFYSSTSSDSSLADIVFTREDIETACNELSSRSSAGGDGVPATLLKSCKTSLSLPLLLLWRKSFDKGSIPASLLQAVICPLHKGGSRSIPKNFRPVALTSHIIKVFERVVRKFLVSYLEANDYMTPGQHGFRSLRSTLTQLLSHFDSMLADLESGACSDTVYLDFAKAFDKVDHGILHHKLRDLGIHDKVGNWIYAFLHNRQQTVVIDGQHSSNSTVLSGVPQGTVLGPVLFLVLIMDISEGTSDSTRISSFADDTRASRPIQSMDDMESLQQDINIIYAWADRVNMEFNGDKFECLRCWPHQEKLDLATNHHYKDSSGSDIEEPMTVKDLGVLFSLDLSFKVHIDKMVKQTNKLIGWVFRTFRARSVRVMMTVWKSLIQSKLDYCSQLWSPADAKTINLLEDIQRHFTSRIFWMKDKDYWERLSELKLYSQERRRERYSIIFIWKCAVGLVDGYTVNIINNPRRGRLCVVRPINKNAPNQVRKASEASLTVRGARLFNLLPRDIRNTDLPLTNSVIPFKTKLDNFLTCIPDQPTVQSRRRPAATNSLLDQIPMTVRSL